MGKTGTFRYVFIPADVGDPLQELSLGYTEADEVQCLLNKLRVRNLSMHPFLCTQGHHRIWPRAKFPSSHDAWCDQHLALNYHTSLDIRESVLHAS